MHHQGAARRPRGPDHPRTRAPVHRTGIRPAERCALPVLALRESVVPVLRQVRPASRLARCTVLDCHLWPPVQPLVDQVRSQQHGQLVLLAAFRLCRTERTGFTLVNPWGLGRSSPTDRGMREGNGSRPLLAPRGVQAGTCAVGHVAKELSRGGGHVSRLPRQTRTARRCATPGRTNVPDPRSERGLRDAMSRGAWSICDASQEAILLRPAPFFVGGGWVMHLYQRTSWT
jgi:hypothetical protein